MQPILLSLMLILANQPESEKEKSTPNAEDAALRASIAKSAREFAGRCEFTAGATTNAKLVLHPEPILRWSNPTAGKVFGEVFVWTDNGRPAVVGSWYRWISPDWGRTFEVCSLSDGRLSGRINDAGFWNSEKPGLILKPLSDVDAPARTAALRLQQMRQLAGDFVANLADTRSTDEGVKRQLRLLPRPVFRYLPPNAESTYLDGGLFAFVEGTDPEAFLVLEATKANNDTHWQYGLVRMNSDALRITFRDELIWTVPKIDNPMNLSQEPYALFVSESVLKAPVDGNQKDTPAKAKQP